jgi:Probable lipid transfer
VFVAMVAFLLVLEGVHGICNVSNGGLKQCLPAIRNNDPVDQPSSDCCAALQNANFRCFCRYKNSYILKAMHLNLTRAVELPEMCGITTAPIQC